MNNYSIKKNMSVSIIQCNMCIHYNNVDHIKNSFFVALTSV